MEFRTNGGVAFDEAGDPVGQAAEGVAGGVDAVASNVEECAAAAVDLIADVGGVVVEVAEEAGDGAELADAAFAQELPEAQPLGVGADHEGFADFDSGDCTDGEEGSGFGDSEAEGFFAEDVLAGFSGFDGPGDVKLVGQGIVDGVDFGVGEEFFVAAVGFWDVEFGGGLLRAGEVARSDGGDGREFAELHGGNDLFEADVGGAEDAPAELIRHGNHDTSGN